MFFLVYVNDLFRNKGHREFEALSNLLNCLNYSKNFYLYCVTHKDIRTVTKNKLLRIKEEVLKRLEVIHENQHLSRSSMNSCENGHGLWCNREQQIVRQILSTAKLEIELSQWRIVHYFRQRIKFLHAQLMKYFNVLLIRVILSTFFV